MIKAEKEHEVKYSGNNIKATVAAIQTGGKQTRDATKAIVKAIEVNGP